MEEEELKTREDFETDSDYWTYRIIHDEEFRKLEEQEEEENKPIYPYLILQCLNCGEIIDENETKPDMKLPYIERVKCKCGKFKFKAISEKKKNELLKNKDKSKLSDYRIKRIIKRIEIDLEKVKADLDLELERGNISNERYIVLMLELISREYDYFSRDVGKKFDWKAWKDSALEVSKAEIEKKYQCEVLDEQLDEIVKSYDEERDLYFLQEYEIMLDGTKQVEEDEAALEELDRKQDSIKRKKKLAIEAHERYAKSRANIEEKQKERIQDKAIDTFKDQLKKDLKKN